MFQDGKLIVCMFSSWEQSNGDCIIDVVEEREGRTAAGKIPESR